MIVVADKNTLEDEKVGEFLASNHNHRVVLTDFVAIESYAGNAVKNISRAMSILSRFPRQVFVLKPSVALIKLGAIEGRYRFDMVDWPQTRAFPAFCASVRLATEGHAAATEAIQQHGNAASEHLQLIERDMPAMAGVIMHWYERTSRELLRARRNNAAMPGKEGVAVLESIVDLAIEMMGTHEASPVPPPTLGEMLNCVLFRYAVAGRLWALWWAERGGVEGMRPEKLRNDMVDLSYAVYATYFDGLMTKDERLRHIYSESRFLIEELLPKHDGRHGATSLSTGKSSGK